MRGISRLNAEHLEAKRLDEGKKGACWGGWTTTEWIGGRCNLTDTKRSADIRSWIHNEAERGGSETGVTLGNFAKQKVRSNANEGAVRLNSVHSKTAQLGTNAMQWSGTSFIKFISFPKSPDLKCYASKHEAKAKPTNKMTKNVMSFFLLRTIANSHSMRTYTTRGGVLESQIRSIWNRQQIPFNKTRIYTKRVSQQPTCWKLL